MPNQPTSKRLLTEATAGAAVTNPATPLGAALAGATAVPKSVLGKPSGVAVLGADGLVPARSCPRRTPVCDDQARHDLPRLTTPRTPPGSAVRRAAGHLRVDAT
jgi:hypothetical protein